MRFAKWLPLAIALIILLASIYYGVTLRTIYTYQLEYTDLPKTDDELQAWLTSQPGVRDAQVRRDEKTIHVQYTTSWWYSSTAVDVMGHAEANGYKGRTAFFTNYHPLWGK